MTSEEIKKIVDKDLDSFEYIAPEPGATYGEPWSEEKVMSYLPKLKAALVEPYFQKFLLKETYEQAEEGHNEYASYWVIAEEDPYYQWYDPDTNEYGLAQKSALDDQLVSIGVRGDLVGVYCAM